MPDSNLADLSVLTSSFYNTYIREQVTVTCTSGTRPTGVEGRVIYETDTDLLLVYSGAAWVPFAGPSTGWTSYTSTVSQGASTNISKTTNYSKYTYVGAKAITWNFSLSLTASGTAGSGLTLTIPLTSASPIAYSGSGRLFDTSTATAYGGEWLPASTTTVSLTGDWSSSGTWGVAPNLAVASGDSVTGTITYEIA